MKKRMRSEFFLPKWTPKQWGWRSITLLSIAVISLIDSLSIPMSRHIDPGQSGEGALFLLLGLRAAYEKEPPLSVVIAGALLSTLAAALNHRLLKPSPFWISAPVWLSLVIFVAYWGRGKQIGGHLPRVDASTQPTPDPTSTLKL
jgi:hypothetical protein